MFNSNDNVTLCSHDRHKDRCQPRLQFLLEREFINCIGNSKYTGLNTSKELVLLDSRYSPKGVDGNFIMSSICGCTMLYLRISMEKLSLGFAACILIGKELLDDNNGIKR